MTDHKELTHSVDSGAPIRAHDKSQYKRLVTQGANVLPPIAPTPDFVWRTELDKVKVELAAAKEQLNQLVDDAERMSGLSVSQLSHADSIREILKALQEQLADATKRAEDAERDAARYRWLRESDWDMFADRWINATWSIYGGTEEELDAAIDREIKEAMK